MIIGACVVHNNSHIFHRTLETFDNLCDIIVIIDDGSTDCSGTNRKRFLENKFAGSIYFNRIDKTEKEIERRTKLWEFICGIGNENDWIILLDSDECFYKKDLKYLLSAMRVYKDHEGINWISTRLYNMWSETEYRVDGFWNPKFELKRRIFKLRKGKYMPRNFNPNTVECGEVPSYVFSTGGLNTECKLLHLGYITKSERQRKYNFHKKVDPDGNFHANEHIESIIKKPTLVKLT